MRAIRSSLLCAAVLATAATAVRAMPVEGTGWNGPTMHRRLVPMRGVRVWCPPMRRHHVPRPVRYGPAEAAWLVPAHGIVVERRNPAVFPVCATTGSCGPLVVVAEPRPAPILPLSPITGQPLTVIYNSPGSFPGAVDPHVSVVPIVPCQCRIDARREFPSARP